LKAVLEADQAQELKGGYRSGKRLDIKKVISYIASNYRKDKIWLRRSDPEKRNF
jgi:midasin